MVHFKQGIRKTFMKAQGVPAQRKIKNHENTVFLKFRDVFPSLDFLELYGYENKFCMKFRVKTKKSISP